VTERLSVPSDGEVLACSNAAKRNEHGRWVRRGN